MEAATMAAPTIVVGTIVARTMEIMTAVVHPMSIGAIPVIVHTGPGMTLGSPITVRAVNASRPTKAASCALSREGNFKQGSAEAKQTRERKRGRVRCIDTRGRTIRSDYAAALWA